MKDLMALTKQPRPLRVPRYFEMLTDIHHISPSQG